LIDSTLDISKSNRKFCCVAISEEIREVVITKSHDKAKKVVKFFNGLPISLKVIGIYLGDECNKKYLKA
jgi:hypothetical protein